MRRYRRIRCRKCGSLVLKKRGLKVFIKNLSIAILLVFLLMTSIIGTLSVYNFVVVGIYDNPDRLFTIGGLYSTLTMWGNRLMTNEDKTTLHKIADGLTKECYTEKCKIKKVYDNLITFDYDIGTDKNSLNIWREKEGDCDEVSNLMVELLKTQGIKGSLVCSDVHCWAVFKADKEKILVDVTHEIFKVIE